LAAIVPKHSHMFNSHALSRKNGMIRMSTTNVPWSDAHKKEARGANGFDLGEVQDTSTYYVHTQKGIGSKTQYYIPKKYFKSYDGRTVRFDVSEAEANRLTGSKFPSDEEYRAKYEAPQAREMQEKPSVAAPTTRTETDIIERIPLISERLDVSKHTHEEEVTITKTPYTETQTKDIPVTHEEISIEETKPSSTRVSEPKSEWRTETIRVPVKHEDVDVSKTAEVREEVVVHKKPVTETRHISEQVRSEKFSVSDNTKATLEEERKKRPM